MFNNSYYDNAQQGGTAQLVVVGREAEELAFVPLRRAEISGEVTGPLAGMQVVHVFGFTRQQCAHVIEAVYRFPLPGDAAVTGVSVRFGDVEIQTQLVPRAEAQEDYERAKRERHQAVLVTREGPDVFSLQVAGIKPDEEVRVETAYVQLARPEGRGWSLRLPLTVPARYQESGGDDRAAAAGPLVVAYDPGYRATLDLTFVHSGEIKSPTHALAVEQDGDEQRVSFADGEVPPDCDAVITWYPAMEGDRPRLSAVTSRQNGRTAFLSMVAPPSGAQQVLPRDLTVLVDHSGSMDGPKRDAADWAVGQLAGMLNQQDRFSLCTFHSTTRWFSEGPRSMDARTRSQMQFFLERYRDGGGTELGTALEQALSRKPAQGAYVRQILIITDAQVTDEGQLLRLAEEESRRQDPRHISVLCIDSAPNETVARDLAEAGGGSDWYLTSNPEGEDITTAIRSIINQWARPIARDLRLLVNAGPMVVTSRPIAESHETGWSALDLGDLPAETPLWVFGEVPTGDGPLSLRVVNPSGSCLATWTDAMDDATGYPAVGRLVGAHRLRQLERLRSKRLSCDEALRGLAVLGMAVPPESVSLAEAGDADAMLGDMILKESLRTGLLSSETGFVAVRSQSGKSVERTLIVPNAVPEGWNMFGMPVYANVCDAMLCREPLEFRMEAPTMLPGLHPSLYQGNMLWPDRASTGPASTTLFDGVPELHGNTAVLAELTVGAAGVPALLPGRLVSLHVEGDLAAFPAGSTLSLYAGDMAQPRARIVLADLLDGSDRPLNIACLDGDRLRLVLNLPAGSPTAAVRLAVTVTIA